MSLSVFLRWDRKACLWHSAGLFLWLQVILTVYLSDTQQMLTEVPVTPATRVIDVVEYCKEAGEGECHLAEVWNGHGESIQTNHPELHSECI